MNEAISAIKDFGQQLGDEIAVGAGMDDQGNPVGPIVLAELKNPADFHAFFDNEVRKLGGTARNAPAVQWIDNPDQTPDPTNSASKESGKQIYVWIDGDVLVAAPKIDQLRTIANNTTAAPFRSSGFHDRIAGVYRDGAGLVVAADLERIIAHTKGSPSSWIKKTKTVRRTRAPCSRSASPATESLHGWRRRRRWARSNTFRPTRIWLPGLW